MIPKLIITNKEVIKMVIFEEDLKNETVFFFSETILFLIESFFLKPMSGFVISVNNEK
jgi:hypothetical protein